MVVLVRGEGSTRGTDQPGRAGARHEPSDHAGGRLGVESAGGGLDDTKGRLRKGSHDSLSFLFIGVLCK